MKKILYLLLLTVLVLTADKGTAEMIIPYEFQAGGPARASEINANFTALKEAIEELDRSLHKRITELEIKNSALEQENRALKAIFAEIVYSAHIIDVAIAIITPIIVLVVAKSSLKTNTPITPIIEKAVPSQKR